TSLSSLAPLARVGGVQFFALAKRLAGVPAPPVPSGMALIDLDPWLHDMADTAAAVQNLDLVITVDTSVAHVAGALGRPGWVMLPFAPDWRWLLDRPDSPWYPTLRLFRQREAGDWTPVVEDIRAALARLAGSF
ncbi:MAG TPA: hypothetical protein VF157_09320, partial [Chloroflexota bacterium]